MGVAEFVADVVVTGSVLGVDQTSSPDQVSDVLGVGFAEDRRRDVMRWDFGLVEFFWQRLSPQSPWRGSHFTVQLHRLCSSGPEVVGEPIQARYGGRLTQRTLTFTDLCAVLEDRGVTLVEVPRVSADVREYRQPDTLVSVLVVDGDNGGPEGLRRGEVWALSVPLPAEVVAFRGDGARASSPRQRLNRLRGGSEAWDRWLARRAPEDLRSVNWWLRLFVVLGWRACDRSDARADWVRLHLWLIRYSEELRVFTTGETAIRTAGVAAALHHRGPVEDLADVLPPAEEIVRACLVAMPLTIEQAQALAGYELRDLDVESMRRSRQAKNLINAAEPHLNRLRDEALADELRRWIAVKPRLV